jgi:hypothetical protein
MFDTFLIAQLVDRKQNADILPKGRYVRQAGFPPAGFNFLDLASNSTSRNRIGMTPIGVGE